jgi:hypothetical protein
MLMMLLTTMTCMKAGRVRVATGQGTQLLRQSTLHQYLRKKSPGMRGLANVTSLSRDLSKTSTSERSEVSETLGERQKSLKYNLHSRMAAELL